MPAVQQVGHTVEVLRAEERDALALDRGDEIPPHGKLVRQRREGLLKAYEVERLPIVPIEGELDAHEEQAELMVLVLVGVEDVGSALVEERGHAGNESLAVRTINQQDGSFFHAIPEYGIAWQVGREDALGQRT
jgi:hypothetical protein